MSAVCFCHLPLTRQLLAFGVPPLEPSATTRKPITGTCRPSGRAAGRFNGDGGESRGCAGGRIRSIDSQLGRLAVCDHFHRGSVRYAMVTGPRLLILNTIERG